MIRSISRENYCVPKVLLKVFGLIVAFALLKIQLFGQEAIDYRGVWQTETPENGTLVLILKRNNLASYFWTDNVDRTVYQGSWSNDANGIILKWSNGKTHRITRDFPGYKIIYSDATDEVLYNTSVKRLPEEILGQWANDPSTAEGSASDRDKARDFFGAWKIGEETNPYYLIVEPDRSAATNWPWKGSNTSGLRGSWAKQSSELHIAWGTGHYGILKQTERGFTFKLITPGSLIEKNTADELSALRINKDLLPKEWNYPVVDQKATQPQGAIFANRTDALSFYRGSWIVQRSEDTFERIEIGRFGRLRTSADAALYGNWHMSEQDIFMNWEDGMRKILSPVGDGFLLYEYKPGRPIDGMPTRIFPAAPEDSNKLARYIKGEKEPAAELLKFAMDAGVIPDTKDSGLTQTLIGWAWPFGDDKSTSLSSALLETNLDSLVKINPWWWPFWSETPPPETTKESGTDKRDAVEIVIDSEPPLKKKTDKALQPDWDWPF